MGMLYCLNLGKVLCVDVLFLKCEIWVVEVFDGVVVIMVGIDM